MAQDVSGFGTILNMVASNTFPNGFTISAFADDGDPIDLPAITINGSAMGLNGDLITWSKASEIKASIAVIEGSDDDTNLAILMEANRVGKGKVSAQDAITLTAVYPSGKTITFNPGVMVQGQPGPSVASAGRLKTKKYDFVFENKNETFV
jgi:hypothetical protein